MKLKPLILLVALSTGCVPQESAYEQASARAKTQPLKSADFGFGFKAGMSKTEAEKRLLEVNYTEQATLELPALGKVTAEIKPNYVADTLVELDVKLKNGVDIPDLEYKELVEMLTARYGSSMYPHKILDDQAQSWFNGPIEIEAKYNDLLGVELRYKDLRRYGAYLHESAAQIMRDLDAQKAKEAKEAQRL